MRKRGAVRRDPITDRSGTPEAGREPRTVPGRPGRAWLTLTVDGMNAEDSPDRLGRVLELCPGVAAAEVAPARGTVTVAYDPRTADVAMLLRLTAMVGTRGRGRVTSVSVTACGGVPWNGAPEDAVARDPICDMRFPPTRAVAQASFAGRTYYFCSKRCRTLFGQHPTWYAGAGTVEDGKRR